MANNALKNNLAINTARKSNANTANSFNERVSAFNAALTGEDQDYTPFSASLVGQTVGTQANGLPSNVRILNPPTYAANAGDRAGQMRPVKYSLDGGKWGYWDSYRVPDPGSDHPSSKAHMISKKVFVPVEWETIKPDPVAPSVATGDGKGGLATRVDALGDALGGLTIADLWDDPATEANENAYDTYWSQLDDISDALGAFDIDFLQGADLTKTVHGTYGPLDVGELPNLIDADIDLYNNLVSDVDAFRSQLGTLQGDRQREEARVNSFRDTLARQLGQLQSSAKYIDYDDDIQINDIRRQLDTAQLDRDLFSSSILDQMGGLGVGNRISGLQSTLDGFSAQRAEAQQRADAARSQITGTIDGLLAGDTSFGSLDAYGSSISGVQDAMRAIQLAEREHGLDMSFERAQLQDRLSQLQSGRAGFQSEMDRVASAEDRFGDRASDLLRALGLSGFNNRTTLDSFAAQLDGLRDDIGDFSSPAPFDFSGVDTASAQAALDDLFTQRQQALNPLFDRLGDVSSAVSGLALEDVEGRQAQVDALRGLSGDLSALTGGRATELRDLIAGQYDLIDQQNADLDTRRGEITADAEAMLEAVQGGSYFEQSDIDSRRNDLDQLAALVDQFGASGAADEIGGIDSFLSGQTNRLQQEAQNLAARNAQGQASANAMLGNSAMLSQLINARTLTDDQLALLLQMSTNQDDPLAQQRFGTFSANIGA